MVELLEIFLYVILPYLIIVSIYFGFVLSSLRKMRKKLSEIEAQLVIRNEKVTVEKEKNREKKLQKLKTDIDDMLKEGKQ